MEPSKSFLKTAIPNISIVLLFILLATQLNSVSRQIDRMNHQLQGKAENSQVSRISHRMEELLQEEKWLTSDHWSVSDVDPDSQTISLQYEWSLREVADDAEILLQIQELNNEREPVTEWETVETDNVGINAYQTGFDVAPALHYRVQIVSKGRLQRISQNIYVPSSLYQPPELVPSSASMNHRTEPDYNEQDVSIGFRLDQFNEKMIKSHPSMSFMPEKITAELWIDGQRFLKELEETESDVPHLPPGQATDIYRKEWVLNFPAFSKGTLESLTVTVEYSNGFVISKDYTDRLFQFFPDL